MIRDNFHREEGARYFGDLDTGYNVVLRRNCHIGSEVKIWSNTVIDAGALVGDRCRIHCNVYISQQCLIGSDVFIGPGTQLLNDLYPPRTDSSWWQPVVVKQGAIIGGGCTILPGVIIGCKAVVGAGSVVTRSVPDFEVWAGNPAKLLCHRDEYDLKAKEVA